MTLADLIFRKSVDITASAELREESLPKMRATDLVLAFDLDRLAELLDQHPDASQAVVYLRIHGSVDRIGAAKP
jgi:hypothetical protein